MRIIARKALREFWELHNDSEQALKSWYGEVQKAEWDTPQEVINDYPRASIIGNSRVIFRIKGNHYRLIIAVNYQYKIVLIKFIGTHAEYDQIDAENVSHY